MYDTAEHEERCEKFIRLERAIEANKQSLHNLNKLTGYAEDCQSIYADVIDRQEQLLMQSLRN
jgi:hypothetical protein